MEILDKTAGGAWNRSELKVWDESERESETRKTQVLEIAIIR